MASQASNVSTNDEDDLVNVEDIEQLCNRISKYEPNIPCNDERLVKLLTLSFETMIRSIVADCARVNKDNNNTLSKTLTSELLSQTACPRNATLR
ncbi:unnamed protein product [Rotaria sordida]|uniref:Uncharacterized protein n=1 Tax=Rotaria sordida TaxID=392033 RepID=A0A814J490_9BILA|nr:unnamed protein product [Rotaria sordida]CAF3847552.1 unnamed protein product [Rotaria sordida]